jgi:serine/threonine protein kinase
LAYFVPEERKRGLGDKEARVLFRQFLSGLHFLHQTGVAHLDIKPDNVLRAKNGELKITDFGMSQIVAQNVLVSAKSGSSPSPATPIKLSGRPGTLRYMPPEVFACESDEEEKKWNPFLADVWSSGLLLFIMLVGFPPFELPSPSDGRFKYIMDGKLASLLSHWGRLNDVDPQALDLLEHMLAPAERRFSLEQVLAHPWVSGVVAPVAPVASPLSITITAPVTASAVKVAPTTAFTTPKQHNTRSRTRQTHLCVVEKKQEQRPIRMVVSDTDSESEVESPDARVEVETFTPKSSPSPKSSPFARFTPSPALDISAETEADTESEFQGAFRDARTASRVCRSRSRSPLPRAQPQPVTASTSSGSSFDGESFCDSDDERIMEKATVTPQRRAAQSPRCASKQHSQFRGQLFANYPCGGVDVRCKQASRGASKIALQDEVSGG